MEDYIVDDRMQAERTAEEIVKVIPEKEREKILKLSYEEQVKAVEEYAKKYGFLEGA